MFKTLKKLRSFRSVWPVLLLVTAGYFLYSYAKYEKDFMDWSVTALVLLIWLAVGITASMLCLVWCRIFPNANRERTTTFMKHARVQMDTLVSEMPKERDRYRWSSWHAKLWAIWNVRYRGTEKSPGALTRGAYWSAVLSQIVEFLVCVLLTLVVCWYTLGVAYTVFIEFARQAYAVTLFAIGPTGQAMSYYLTYILLGWTLAMLIEWIDIPHQWRKHVLRPVEIIFDVPPAGRTADDT